MFAGVVDDRVVHALAGDAATHVVARAAATGAVTESVTNAWTERRSDWPQFGATTVTHLEFDPAERPDDPDLAGARWVARRGVDLTPLITLDTVVDAPPCLVGDHLYAAGTDGLLRVALDRPVPSLTLLHPEPRVPIACDRHRDVDVVWLPGHVLGVTDDGAPAWFVDLDGWSLAGHERTSEVLPDRPLVFVGRPPREQRLLLLDLREHRVVGAVDVADFVARVHHDPRRSFVGLAARRPGQAWLMSTFDGSTGAPGGAVFVDAAPPLSFHVLGDTLWLTGDGPAAARLDPSTLQPRDAQPALGLRDASEWLAARWPAVLAPPRAGPPGEPQGPPRLVRPLLDRDPGPMPRWAREPLDAATRALAHADATRPVWLLAWDIQESSEGERSHHAVVALELADARGGPRWLVALMQRRFASELAERSPESAAPWGVLETSRWPRRLIVARRPTGADLERLLVRSSVWTDASYAGSRLLVDGWFVDGNVIDSAWHELTGEAPRWSYPAPLERPE
ncbi:hypothetical protein OV203_20905 [Nannocystis sp. ILAH1]|uniref:hypothetical protein n=1 Tax=Nannocystis sp. ILAH1 TaxID=2996789 RepID=UPI00226FF638|nr:hypothetical protein [Nannocystis sp. ILAH1]MCY0989610.1 hypothetical protein [Nannocystis sp. ILAH1]